MATLIPCVKNDFVKNDGKCNIKIRLSHDQKVRYLKTPYYIEPGMLGRNGKVKPKHANYIELNAALTKLIDEYNSLFASLGPDIRYMDVNTMANKLRCNEANGASFLKYANRRIKELKEEGRHSYAISYEASNKWLAGFTDILFKEINHEFLEKFQKHLKKNGKKVNTIRIYLTHNINVRLSLIGKSFGINDLTTYYARYSWSTIASSLGVLQDTISHALGHV
ncbi:MAG TPA: phage integrase SAM-like domain-containing protein [Bacteroidales bacterium]|nr:phage integrase SAM-like domain-containing protein [Bacteroidales bacterium]